MPALHIFRSLSRGAVLIRYSAVAGQDLQGLASRPLLRLFFGAAFPLSQRLVLETHLHLEMSGVAGPAFGHQVI